VKKVLKEKSRILKHLIIVRTIMAGIPYINNYFGTKAQNLPLLKIYCLFQQLRSVLSQFEKKFLLSRFFTILTQNPFLDSKAQTSFLFLKIERKLRLICQKVDFLREKTFLLKHKSV
jgi:hypothetical protein